MEHLWHFLWLSIYLYSRTKYLEKSGGLGNPFHHAIRSLYVDRKGGKKVNKQWRESMAFGWLHLFGWEPGHITYVKQGVFSTLVQARN